MEEVHCLTSYSSSLYLGCWS